MLNLDNFWPVLTNPMDGGAWKAAVHGVAKSWTQLSDFTFMHWRRKWLPHPWDSPGKNTGVGCHFLLQCMKVKSLSCVQIFATPWTAAYQAPPSMGFSRQEYWSGVPLPSLKLWLEAVKLLILYYYSVRLLQQIAYCLAFL